MANRIDEARRYISMVSGGYADKDGLSKQYELVKKEFEGEKDFLERFELFTDTTLAYFSAKDTAETAQKNLITKLQDLKD